MTDPKPPDLQFVFEARIDLGTPLEFGHAGRGERRVIPIAGGTFAGPSIRGLVISGGADWQVVGDDGIVELDARYTLETDSGKLIYVSNQGIRRALPGGAQYFRTVPHFETPVPELQWLSRSVFICTGERFSSHVILQYWQVL